MGIKYVFLIIYKIMVYYVYSLQLPRSGDSNEYSTYIDKTGKIPQLSLNICFKSFWKNFLGTQNEFNHGKQDNGVRVLKVFLYSDSGSSVFVQTTHQSSRYVILKKCSILN